MTEEEIRAMYKKPMFHSKGGATQSLVDSHRATTTSGSDREPEATVDGGGLRYNSGKPEIHQVPPSLVIAVAKVFKYGEKKYEKGNWKRGMAWSKPYDCLMRHMFSWLSKEEQDAESGLSHLYHAAANIAMLIEYAETYKEGDDR